jgi:hypothetical protein
VFAVALRLEARKRTIALQDGLQNAAAASFPHRHDFRVGK